MNETYIEAVIQCLAASGKNRWRDFRSANCACSCRMEEGHRALRFEAVFSALGWIQDGYMDGQLREAVIYND